MSHPVIEKGEAEVSSSLLYTIALPPGAEADGKPVSHKQQDAEQQH